MEAGNLVKQVVSIVYFMRGSIQYDDMMFRTPAERDVFEEFIKERMELQKKIPYPIL